MITASIVDNNLIELLKQFNLFKRNKIPLEIKLTAIAMHIPQASEETLPHIRKSTLLGRKIQRRTRNEKKEIKKLAIARTAVDDTFPKYNGKNCYLYAAHGGKQDHIPQSLPS